MFSAQQVLEMGKDIAESDKVQRNLDRCIVGPWGEDEDKVLIASNWNEYDDDDTARRVCSILDKMDGVHVDWDDEVAPCSECGYYMRTQPTHYGWMGNYIDLNHGILCYKCFEQNPEDYIEEIFINNPERALKSNAPVHPEDLGFEKYNGQFNSGLREGSNDNPHEVLAELSDEMCEVMFYIDSVGQFDTNWSAYIRS